MKAILINGSPRIGNTYQALLAVKDILTSQNIEVEIIQLGVKKISGCKACGMCNRRKNKQCAIDDDLNPILKKIFEADCLVIGSPTYFSNVTTEVKALIDRLGFVSLHNDNPMKYKVGAAVVTVRRAGSNMVYSAINYLFGILNMTIATSTYWNNAITPGNNSFKDDEEGIETMKELGYHIVKLLQKY